MKKRRQRLNSSALTIIFLWTITLSLALIFLTLTTHPSLDVQFSPEETNLTDQPPITLLITIGVLLLISLIANIAVAVFRKRDEEVEEQEERK